MPCSHSIAASYRADAVQGVDRQLPEPASRLVGVDRKDAAGLGDPGGGGSRHRDRVSDADPDVDPHTRERPHAQDLPQPAGIRRVVTQGHLQLHQRRGGRQQAHHRDGPASSSRTCR